jgi:hypothetical protein
VIVFLWYKLEVYWKPLGVESVGKSDRGWQMSVHPNRIWRNAALAAVVAGSSLLAGYSAGAQPLPQNQCRLANAAIGEIFTKYDGKLSEQFVTSVKSFVAKNCDMDTDFKMVDGTQDKAAFGELRLRLIAFRTSQAGKPAALTE